MYPTEGHWVFGLTAAGLGFATVVLSLPVLNGIGILFLFVTLFTFRNCSFYTLFGLLKCLHRVLEIGISRHLMFWKNRFQLNNM